MDSNHENSPILHKCQCKNAVKNALGIPPSERRPIRINKIADARRLLARIILQLQKGEIENKNAKDIAYLCICFLQVAQQTDIENRIQILEEKLLETKK